ncbi:MAG: ketosamine-3-kinase [Marivirga sp.]|nr:ketosamine-3-kinase [Marivirga sp.]
MVRDIPVDVQSGVKSLFNTGKEIGLIDFMFTGGGCINDGGRLNTTAGVFFLKWNESGKFPSMFEAEAKGLNLLRATRAIHIPEVIGYGDVATHQFLLLEFVEQNKPSTDYWNELGHQLALLHKVHDDLFGLAHNNYIGSLRQFNRQNSSWIDFFIGQRLQVQLKIAFDAGLINSSDSRKFDQLYLQLPSLLPEEKPSLLHGDLWNGNILSNKNGSPCLIDPAVYFGNREADLAMTLLFGAFHDDFYTSYAESFPLMSGYRDRVDLYNLYPLLVHLNLFGTQYLSRITAILKTFI